MKEFFDTDTLEKCGYSHTQFSNTSRQFNIYGHKRGEAYLSKSGSVGRVLRPVKWVYVKKTAPKPNKSVGEQFIELAKNWKKETAIYSFVSKKITNTNYVNIIGLGVVYGEPVIKLILQDLEKGNEFWHYALKKITDDNPVAKEDINNLSKVRAAWLSWAAERKLI
jgi:hypothetical protein